MSITRMPARAEGFVVMAQASSRAGAAGQEA
jgi:hypothetical protein